MREPATSSRFLAIPRPRTSRPGNLSLNAPFLPVRWTRGQSIAFPNARFIRMRLSGHGSLNPQLLGSTPSLQSPASRISLRLVRQLPPPSERLRRLPGPPLRRRCLRALYPSLVQIFLRTPFRLQRRARTLLRALPRPRRHARTLLRALFRFRCRAQFRLRFKVQRQHAPSRALPRCLFKVRFSALFNRPPPSSIRNQSWQRVLC